MLHIKRLGSRNYDYPKCKQWIIALALERASIGLEQGPIK